MEAATIARVAEAIAERLKNSGKNKNENTSSIWTTAISATVGIVLLPAMFIFCFCSSLHLKGVAGSEATYGIVDETGTVLIYKTTSSDEFIGIQTIKNLLKEEGTVGGASLPTDESGADETGGVSGISGVSGIYNNNIELLLQWDSRWGGKSYGSSTIGKGGCGPTSLAMIINSFGGNVTPLDVANYSVRAGYRVDGVGTSWGLFTTGAKAFGLNGAQISRSKESIKAAIGSGKPIISSMTRGHFTTNGHFIVIADCSEDGSKVYIKDPNSAEKSKWWDTSLVINESAAMWAFAAA